MSQSLDQVVEELSLGELPRKEIPSPPGVAPMCAIAIPWERSFKRWREVDAKAKTLGYRAVGIGDEQSVELLGESTELVDTWDREEAIARAKAFDVPVWLKEREAEFTADDHEIPHGSWQDPADPPSNRFWFPYEKGTPLNPWWMGLIPAELGWQVPLALAYGNWNDCPDPIVHAALARRWNRQYRAVLVAISHDTIEFMVSRPPTNREEALTLAAEQYLYCTDIVDQGIGSIAALGASLINQRTWSF